MVTVQLRIAAVDAIQPLVERLKNCRSFAEAKATAAQAAQLDRGLLAETGKMMAVAAILLNKLWSESKGAKAAFLGDEKRQLQSIARNLVAAITVAEPFAKRAVKNAREAARKLRSEEGRRVAAFLFELYDLPLKEG